MNKRHLHHIWVRIRPVSYWYFLAAFILSSVVAVAALRQNNLRAIELRNAVLVADEQNGDVEAALYELRGFVHSHMNADLSSGATAISHPVQLKYRYERLVKAEKERVSAANDDIYNEAQVYCEQQFPDGLSGRNRIPCIEQYVSTNGGEKVRDIPEALYKFDFVSPRWSPDLAGWSLLISGLFLLLFVSRLSLELWLKHQLDS